MGRHRKPEERFVTRKYWRELSVISFIIVAFGLAFFPSVGSADVSSLDPLNTQLENCQRMLAVAQTQSEIQFAQDCINLATRALTPTTSPSSSPSASPSSSPSASPSSSPSASPSPTPSNSPSASPSPTPTQPASNKPIDCRLPGTNTGWQAKVAESSLVKHIGLWRITTPGAVISNVDAVDGIEVKANNVTIMNSRVEGKNTGPGAGIWIDAQITGTKIINVEVRSHDGYDPKVEASIVDRAITGFNTRGTVMDAVCAHDMIRGLQFGCDTVIKNSWIGNEVNPSDDHMSAIGGETCDGSQSPGGVFKLTVDNNTVNLSPNDMDSAALLYYPPQRDTYGPQNVTISITNNVINGGTYCMWLSSDSNGPMSGTLNVSGNVLGNSIYPNCGKFGIVFTDKLFGKSPEGNMIITWSGNTRSDGTPVNRPTS